MTIPSQAASKLGTLADAAADAQAIVSSSLVRIQQLEDGLTFAPNSERSGEFKAELTRLTARRSAQQGRFLALTATVTAIKAWLAGLPANVAFEVIEPPAFQLKDGETVTSAVERARSIIVATQREADRVRNAALPVETIKAHASDYVNKLVERGRPSIHCDHNTAFSVSIPSHGWTVKSPVMEMLAWLDPQRLLARIHAEIEADAAASMDQLRLSSTERSELLKVLTETLDDAERQEEELITRAADAGTDIPRRPDASPAAILGVKASRKAKAVAA
jgi:hypothetical protein